MSEARNLFLAGGAHARAAHALAAAARTQVSMLVPFYLLVGNALETIIKAAFLHLGSDEKQDLKIAKYEIGHDLPKALAYARNRGFEVENQNLEWLTKAMAEVHRRHSFRYLTGDGELPVADNNFCLPIIDDLVIQVGAMLHPERSRESWLILLKQFEVSAR